MTVIKNAPPTTPKPDVRPGGTGKAKPGKKTKVKKKRSRGKSKGNAFEREVSGWFDRWWITLPKTFWRTSNSGGWTPEPGDIAPRLRQGHPPVWWPFICECKFYKAISFKDLLDTKKALKNNKLLLWWAQVTRESKQAVTIGRHPSEVIRLLVFKANNTPIYVAFTPKDFGALAIFPPEILKPLLISTRPDRETLWICTLTDFIASIPKKSVYAAFAKPTEGVPL